MELTQTETKDIVYTEADMIRLERKLKDLHKMRFIELQEKLRGTSEANLWMRKNLGYTPEGSRMLSMIIEADHASFALLSSMVNEAKIQNTVKP